MSNKARNHPVKEAAKKLNELSYDVRAEAIVSDLIINGYSREDIEIQFESSHRINWDKDLSKVEPREGKLIFHLNRDGIIHSLPEFLFLKPLEGSQEEIARLMEFNRKQVRASKILFTPLENELFNEGVNIESNENQLIAAINAGNNSNLSSFWRINPELDILDQIKLCRIIPHLHSIVGDFQLTASCLRYLLEEEITWKLTYKPLHNTVENEVHEDTSPGLGFASCGVETFLAGEPAETVPTLVFTIGPLHAQQINQFQEKGKKHELIKTFISYCIPLQYEIEIRLDVAVEESGFSLENSYLGLNAIL